MNWIFAHDFLFPPPPLSSIPSLLIWFSEQQDVTIGNLSASIFDVGGHAQARRIWRDYMVAVDGIVFMGMKSVFTRYWYSSAFYAVDFLFFVLLPRNILRHFWALFYLFVYWTYLFCSWFRGQRTNCRSQSGTEYGMLPFISAFYCLSPYSFLS